MGHSLLHNEPQQIPLLAALHKTIGTLLNYPYLEHSEQTGNKMKKADAHNCNQHYILPSRCEPLANKGSRIQLQN
jgi:hypothetical protein